MDYFKFQIETDATNAEILMALLAEWPFDTFEETDRGLNAFIPTAKLSAETETYLAELQQQFGFRFQKEFIPGENWNVVWESNFHPVLVGDFCGIRADFHPPLQNVEFELVINPKMAFGTGHHETTFMVVEAMRDLPFKNAKVLDYGCGTGVLAILASKLGASQTDAVDIEAESYRNTLENCRLNNVENVVAYEGTLEAVPGSGYDIILANINRNVILDSLSSLSRMLNPGGLLVVSGFVKDDETLMAKTLSLQKFVVLEIKRKNNWLAMVAQA